MWWVVIWDGINEGICIGHHSGWRKKKGNKKVKKKGNGGKKKGNLENGDDLWYYCSYDSFKYSKLFEI